MLKDKTISFIGSGAMGSSIIAALRREEVTEASNIRAADPNQEVRRRLSQRFPGIEVLSDNRSAVSSADVVVLSIKPQTLDKVMPELQGKLAPHALVLSIIAGAPMSKIMNGLAHGNVVRSMPNTPAQIGKGITVWIASAMVSEEQQQMARLIIGGMGQEIQVDDEKYLDMATALSGTGPAYVFLFMEAMVDAGVHLGFSRRESEQLVTQTVLGSVEYYLRLNDEQQYHLARMRNQVTSPGGTTAAALYFLEKAGFRTAISRAVWAAYERSQELGQDPKAHAPEPPGA